MDRATRSGHVEPSSLRKLHVKAFEIIAREASERMRASRPFVLYTRDIRF